MFIWIAIYSAFESFDFYQEVVILCGTTDFWLAVISAMAIALGMS